MNAELTQRTLERKTKVPFTIQKHLSKSNFNIYLCHSPNKTQQYAMKVFPYIESCIDPRFEKERIASRFSHPNIIAIRDAQTNSKTCSKDGKNQQEVSYILMDYAPYGTMSELIWLKRLPQDDKLIRTMFRYLVQGVMHMHSAGFAHTDLKPENILIGDEHIPMISDFESMVEISEFEELDSYGTPNFRAPEVANDECNDPVAADIYSLGIILLTMVFGQNPYFENMVVKGMNLHQMLQEGDELFWTVHSEAKLPQSETESFKKLAFDMTRKNPNRRTTLEHLAENRWYKGEIYTKDEYVNIMKNCGVCEC